MKKKIMVVDDEESFLEVISKILEKAGFETIQARNGYEALELIKKEKPDLILLDVMMPDIDGWSLSAKIRQNKGFKNVPIAMLTVRGSEEDKLKTFQLANANWHITKPVDKEKLISTVNWLLTSKKKLNEKEI